jgi:hypothetical protein
VDGKCDWTFYDWPGGRLTGVYECQIVSSGKWKQGTLLREWTRFTDLQAEGKQTWNEQYSWSRITPLGGGRQM